MPGPLPSPIHQRESDTRRRLKARTAVTSDGVVRGPDLIEASGQAEWHDATLRWWNAWRLSAQAQTFLPTDWERLLLIAPLRDVIARNPQRPSTSAIAELRLNEERLGATHADRIRLRMHVDSGSNVDSRRPAMSAAARARATWVDAEPRTSASAAPSAAQDAPF